MAIRRPASYKKARLNPCTLGVLRIIDANRNRLKEGLRVCEEITRFILGSAPLTRELKYIRHTIDDICVKAYPAIKLISSRDSARDVGKNIYANELKRKNAADIFYANIQRVKESIRVLEEFSKLKSRKFAAGIKELRYRIYEIEKRTASKLQALRDH